MRYLVPRHPLLVIRTGVFRDIIEKVLLDAHVALSVNHLVGSRFTPHDYPHLVRLKAHVRPQ